MNKIAASKVLSYLVFQIYSGRIAALLIIFLGLTSFYLLPPVDSIDESRFISHTVDLNNQDLKFYWRDNRGSRFGNFYVLKDWAEENGKELVFAMNGGMYKRDHSPQGLYIENGVQLAKLDTIKKAYGNFYLQPNGVFYVTNDNRAVICKTQDFMHGQKVKYATQSGPLLLINGKFHPRLIKGSKNLNIRNGVGVLPDGSLLFAMSKEKVNFYDFATYFKDHGCKNALYLDGLVSRTYLPSKDWVQTDGSFGVIIAETKKKK